METCLQPVYFCLFVVYLMTLSVTQIMCKGCPENFAAHTSVRIKSSFFLSFSFSFFFMSTAAPQSTMFSRAYVDNH